MLSNRLRIVPVNAADSAAVSVSSSASASTPAANLQNSVRTDIWRSVGTSATITAILASSITPVSCVALMTGNLSAAATWNVTLYDATNAVLYDSGSVQACPPGSFSSFDWGFQALGVNSFSFGMGSQAILWLPSRYSVAKVVVSVSDPSNTAGYVEASRLVIGDVWTPKVNHSYGASLTWSSLASSRRYEDGSLRSIKGAKMRKMSLSLDSLMDSDRRVFDEIAQQLGTVKDFLISTTPISDDPSLTASHTMLGKFTRDPSRTHANIVQFKAPFEIEEV